MGVAKGDYNNNFEKIKVHCPYCDAEFIKSISKLMNPAFGVILFCKTCDRKMIWWNDRLFTMHEPPNKQL